MATTIRVKRSDVSGNPPVLAAGELAYSNLTDNGSNGGDRLYIGMGTETAGNAASHVVIGGKYFTDQVTNATSSSTPNTLVRRDASGNVSVAALIGSLTGNADTATKWKTERTITLTGNVTGSVSIDGSGDVSLTTTIPAGTVVTSVTGTANQVSVSGSTGAVTISLPQNIHTGATPTFAGLTVTGTVNMSSQRLTQLADPVNPQDAATKAYVDASQAGLDVKQSVRAATTTNITLSGTQTVDTVALVAGNRVLVKNQTDATTNGIYVVATGAWSRSTDANSGTNMNSGMFVFIEEGSQADSGWVLTTTGAVTVGTTALSFTQFSGGGQLSTGTGLVKNGNVLSIDPNYVGQSSIITLGTVTTGTWNGTAISASYGGTGITSYAVGDLLVASSATSLSKLSIGAAGKVLQSNGTTLVYADVDGGTY